MPEDTIKAVAMALPMLVVFVGFTWVMASACRPRQPDPHDAPNTDQEN